MKRAVLVLALLSSVGASAESGDITIKVESHTNISGNGAMEVCGSAVHKNGLKPLMITIKHDESYYTTLAGPNDRWCTVVKRWTFKGTIDVSGTTLQSPNVLLFQKVDVTHIE